MRAEDPQLELAIAEVMQRLQTNPGESIIHCVRDGDLTTSQLSRDRPFSKQTRAARNVHSPIKTILEKISGKAPSSA